MNKRTKALDIPKKVKDIVWERDGRRCIVCGSPQAMPNAHYIGRAQSGLGIEKNVVTLCLHCHNRYDNGGAGDRQKYKELIREYLQGKYPGWNEEELIYKKEG